MIYDIILFGVVILLVLFALIFILAPLYFIYGFGKKLYHDLLGWHLPTDHNITYDKHSAKSICKYCGKKIVLDNRGSWIVLKERNKL